MTRKLFEKIKPLIPIVVVVLTIAVLSLYIPKEKVAEVILSAGPLAPLVFILINLSTFIFAPLSGTPITAIGFYLFGSDVIIYGAIVVIIASITNFWIARLWGITLVSRLAGKDNMQKINKFVENHGLITLFIAKIFLRGFDDMISYASGLTNMRFAPYIIISILAQIPGTILFYYLSKLTNNIFEFTLMLVGTSALLVFVYPLLKKRGASKSEKN